MSVLTDPVTAQYTHTLTVNGRHEGKYKCTILNNKPSTATAAYTVLGNSIHDAILYTILPHIILVLVIAHVGA